MAGKLLAHLRQQWMGALALLLVLTGGTAYALDGPLAGQNTVGSLDIINGEVTADDLAANSVGSAKVTDRSIKNADLSIGASNSNTIADGGIQGVDVKNNTLTAAQVDEQTLFNDNSLNNGDIDESTLPFVRGSGRAIGRARAIPAGFFGTMLGTLFGDPEVPFNLFYHCPATPPTENGLWRFRNDGGEAMNLFVDDGGANPAFAGELTAGAETALAAAPGGEYMVFSAHYANGRIFTISGFSYHRASDCHVQAQAVLTDAP